MIRTPIRTAAAAVATLLAATGLVAGTSVAADAASTTTYVHISKAHTLSMPHHIRPGVHTFRITASTDAAFQLVRPHRGYTVAMFVDDTNKGLGGGDLAHLRRLERNTELLGGETASPGHPGTLVARVPHGRFWAVDTGPDHATKAQVLTGTTRGGYAQRRIDGVRTITAAGEVHFNSAPGSIPTHGMLRFVNASEDNHFIEMVRLAPGKTYSDFVAWIDDAKKGGQSPPPVDEAHHYFNGILGPHRTMSGSYTLPRGDYVVTCFWPDADMGGMPHAFMGMYREIHVS